MNPRTIIQALTSHVKDIVGKTTIEWHDPQPPQECLDSHVSFLKKAHAYALSSVSSQSSGDDLSLPRTLPSDEEMVNLVVDRVVGDPTRCV